MITHPKILYLYVETPLHAGVGSGLSSIDLPIQRERTTRYPMIQGSSIKGKLRATAEEMAKNKQAPFDNEELVPIMFGPRKEGSEHAGALIVGDARILLFPVRSLSGVFAYTTSYEALNRFMRDVNRSEMPVSWKLLQTQQPEHTAHVTKGRKSRVSVEQRTGEEVSNKVVLEEFSFTAEPQVVVDDIAGWIAQYALPQTSEYAYWREKMQDSLVILPEDDFRDFVVNATEIITRISIDRQTKTATGKALWTEEHLPTDTLLYAPIYATDARKVKENGDQKVPALLAADILQKASRLEEYQQGYLQLGGDETVGRGMVRMHWTSKRAGDVNDTTIRNATTKH